MISTLESLTGFALIQASHSLLPTKHPTLAPTVSPTPSPIILEVTEVSVAASLTLTNVNMSNADKNELVDALTPVLADIVSDSLSESQELIEVVITAVNGQQVNSVRRLEVAGTLRADFVAIVEEMETCSGECEGDVGKPDQEVGDASKHSSTVQPWCAPMPCSF